MDDCVCVLRRASEMQIHTCTEYTMKTSDWISDIQAYKS